MSKKPTPYLMFCYGTLMSSYGNNPILTRSGTANLRGRATTMQKFYMSGGGFPRVAKKILGEFPASESRNDFFAQVHGELWEIDEVTLKACDRLESHPDFYCREEIPVTLDKGRARHTAWMYIVVEPFRGHACLPKTAAGVLEWQPGVWAAG
jgi:gamma-glutamylcyclotransferase (GGCT)/AIG2-like uncharacterized protein YtfP